MPLKSRLNLSYHRFGELCEIHNLFPSFSCVRPHTLFSAQIYNKKMNCANAQHVFCTKNKKKLIFVSLFEKL